MAPDFFELLREHGVAFVFADTAGKWPYAEDLTSDFVYARLHGDAQIYVSGYTEHALQDWAARLRTWAKGRAREDAKLATPHRPRRIRDLYVYFDNDVKVKAPENARRLAELLGAGRTLVKSAVVPSCDLGVPDLLQLPPISRGMRGR